VQDDLDAVAGVGQYERVSGGAAVAGQLDGDTRFGAERPTQREVIGGASGAAEQLRERGDLEWQRERTRWTHARGRSYRGVGFVGHLGAASSRGAAFAVSGRRPGDALVRLGDPAQRLRQVGAVVGVEVVARPPYGLEGLRRAAQAGLGGVDAQAPEDLLVGGAHAASPGRARCAASRRESPPTRIDRRRPI
jgi:hypothetical protein